MTGTPISALTALSGNTLTIHGLFTGSIQGMQTVEQSTKLIFANADGTAGGNCADLFHEQPHHRLFRCVRCRHSLSGDRQLR